MTYNLTDRCRSSQPAHLFIRTDSKRMRNRGRRAKITFEASDHPKYHIFSDDPKLDSMSRSDTSHWGARIFGGTVAALNAMSVAFRGSLELADTAAPGHPNNL